MYFTNPVFENIPLLAKPILHYTIFGVAPREIMGEAAFKKVKAEVQARADHHCEICGRYVAHTMRTQDWIHTHEVYHVNHNEHLYTFQEFVGICQECHLFIHQGYLHTLLTEDSITEKYYDDVIQHGTELLKLIKGYKVPNLNLEDIYMMEYEGEYYINDFYPEVAKALYETGVHILHYHEVEKTLPEEMYHKPK